MKKVDILDSDSLGNTCIHLTAQAGSLNCLQYLFERFYSNVATKNEFLVERVAKTLNRFEMTPLHSACKVRLHISLRISVWIQAYISFFQNNKPEIVDYFFNRFLKELNSDNCSLDEYCQKLMSLIEQKDAHGRSPWSISFSADFKEIIQIFQSHSLSKQLNFSNNSLII